MIHALLVILGFLTYCNCAQAQESKQSDSRIVPALDLKLEAVYPTDLPAETVQDSSAKTINALRITLKNITGMPVQLLWCDFFVRINNGPWIGSWWEPSLDTPSKLQRVLDNDLAMLGPQLPPGQSVQYVLTDPWISEQDLMEYKFHVLALDPSANLQQFSSAATVGVPLELETSGIARAVAGITSAIKSLLPPNPQTEPAKPGEFGASIEHKPVGPVEASKSTSLQQSILAWQETDPTNTSRKIYAYQTEVVNNTNGALRLVQMELSLAYGENWLSGTLRPALFSEQDIVDSGYLQKISPDGETELEKLQNTWIPPGARIVLPFQWHPQESPDMSTVARWRAVLARVQGPPVFAEGQTDPNMPVLSAIPSPNSGEAP